MDQDVFFPPAEDNVKDVKLVLVRAKNTRFCLLRVNKYSSFAFVFLYTLLLNIFSSVHTFLAENIVQMNTTCKNLYDSSNLVV